MAFKHDSSLCRAEIKLVQWPASSRCAIPPLMFGDERVAVKLGCSKVHRAEGCDELLLPQVSRREQLDKRGFGQMLPLLSRRFTRHWRSGTGSLPLAYSPVTAWNIHRGVGAAASRKTEHNPWSDKRAFSTKPRAGGRHDKYQICARRSAPNSASRSQVGSYRTTAQRYGCAS